MLYELSAKLNRISPIMSPTSKWRQAWDALIMLFVLYNCWSVPMSLSYGLPGKNNIVNYIEYGIDFCFAIDIFFNFRTAYIDTTGE